MILYTEIPFFDDLFCPSSGIEEFCWICDENDFTLKIFSVDLLV